VLAGVTFILFTSCGGGDTTDYAALERQSFYLPGLPSFQMQVSPSITGEGSGIDLLLRIPNTSAVFILSGARRIASILIEIQVFESTKGELILERAWPEGLSVETYAATQALDAWQIEKHLPLPPGEFVVHVFVQDQNTGKRAMRRQHTTVGDVIGMNPVSGEMRIFSLEGKGDPAPLLGSQIGGSADSMRISFQVHNVAGDQTVHGLLTIVRYGSDTTVALPPFSFSAMPGALSYTGIDEEQGDTIQTVRQVMTNLDGRKSFQTTLQLPGPGVFAFATSFTLGATSAVHTGPRRVLAVMQAGFPRPSTLHELVGPLRYLASKREWDTIDSATTLEEQRIRFEEFWLRTAGSADAASNLIRQYYTRVEEANLHFSSFKEGWRTDRGMLYIILGPPLVVQTGINSEIWRYSSSDQDVVNTYSFQRVHLPSNVWPFEQYLLDRQAYYDQPWLVAVERWRRGRGF